MANRAQRQQEDVEGAGEQREALEEVVLSDDNDDDGDVVVVGGRGGDGVKDGELLHKRAKKEVAERKTLRDEEGKRRRSQMQTTLTGQVQTTGGSAHKSAPKASPVTEIRKPGLRLRRWQLFTKAQAHRVFQELEEPGAVEYYPKSMTRVKVYGKWHDTSRKMTAYGDPGMAYSFSSCRVSCKPWTKLLLRLKQQVEDVVRPPKPFNFVLVNRYNDGREFIGRHRDDERELDPRCPIASLTFGQTRDFVLHHAHVVQKRGKHRDMKPVTVPLSSGTLLSMDPPTNTHWYHAVPKRATSKVPGPRINLTFRHIDPAKMIPAT